MTAFGVRSVCRVDRLGACEPFAATFVRYVRRTGFASRCSNTVLLRSQFVESNAGRIARAVTARLPSRRINFAGGLVALALVRSAMIALRSSLSDTPRSAVSSIGRMVIGS